MCDRNTNTPVKDELDKSDKKDDLNELTWKIIILERFDLKYEVLLIRMAAVKSMKQSLQCIEGRFDNF